MPGMVGPPQPQIQSRTPDPHEAPQTGQELALRGIAAIDVNVKGDSPHRPRR